jgi:alpha-glucosidase (family GH31 glycosyl hydrolase)
MLRTTSQALYTFPDLRDKRQFMLTRGTFSGSGRYASYAVRPKYRSWDALRQSIPHVMQMNMLGMVHTGVDVCGFYEDDNERTELDEELCLRWLQLTTVLPLARHT